MRKKVPIALKFDPDLLDRLDAFQSRLPYDTTRTALMEAAVREMLDREEKKAGRK